MDKGGYCVDYVKSRIPSFPMPTRDDMPTLKNVDIAEVTEGDVAIFAIKSYWHVAYVESVHRNAQGEPLTIDVSEMNFGNEPSFVEFRSRWKLASRDEWQRALCCGITDNYDEITMRKNVDVTTVRQVWSPDDAAREGTAQARFKALMGRVKEVINSFRELADI
ncbi:hypothetical protein [Geomonas agri]|uniref:hypothetical protein n=1 Tax=Geomonas agri TaxID=2873702 RepID=UPI001CD3B6EC|nr:hypothetical protein [Geomonas agri]